MHTHTGLNQTGAALSSCSKCIRASQSYYTQPPVQSGGKQGRCDDRGATNVGREQVGGEVDAIRRC